MIGLAKNVCVAEWGIKEQDLDHPQVLTLRVHGITKPWRGECKPVLLAHTEVTAYRTEEDNEIIWYGPKDLSVHLKIRRKITNIRITVSAPEEMMQALSLFDKKRTEISMPMDYISNELNAGDTAHIMFPQKLLKFS